MGETSYEVLAEKGGRWEIDSRYGRMGRGQAVDRAKALESGGGYTAVKVIREVTDDDGESTETVIHSSGGGGGGGARGERRAQPAAPFRPSAAPEKPAPEKPTSSKPAKKKGKKPSAEATAEAEVDAETTERRAKFRRIEKQAFTAVGKVIAVMLTGMIAAVALTWALASVINNIDINVLAKRSPELADLLGGQSRPTVLIGIFIGTFLLFAIPVTISIVRKATHAARRERKEKEEFGARMLEQVLEEKAAARGTVLSTGKSAADIVEMTGGVDDDDETPQAPPRVAEKKAEENAKGEEEKAEEKKVGVETFDEEWGLTDEQKVKKKQDDDNEIEVRGLPPLAQQARGRFMQFFGASLQEVKAANIPLNAHNRLGSCLYLAGACEILGRDHDLDPHFVQVMVTEIVRLLGIEGNQALDFGRNYQGYLLNNPQYLDMFNRGRAAMSLYLGDDPAKARKELIAALQGWESPQAAEGGAMAVTVLVTDVPGLTDVMLTQGQLAVEDLTQAHFRIVADALARWGGREIKRTASGIVAIFATAPQAVEAATQVHMQTVQHNHEKPHLLVPVRMGLHSGMSSPDNPDPVPAIAETALRIAEKGGAGQTLASTAVAQDCAGKQLYFGERGGVILRDATEPLTLHELLWNREMEVREDTLTQEERLGRVAAFANAIEEAAAQRDPNAPDGAPPPPPAGMPTPNA